MAHLRWNSLAAAAAAEATVAIKNKNNNSNHDLVCYLPTLPFSNITQLNNSPIQFNAIQWVFINAQV
jgi:hypothetical protein